MINRSSSCNYYGNFEYLWRNSDSINPDNFDGEDIPENIIKHSLHAQQRAEYH